jgi:2-haloalkanoic acid dehalogenase type II
MDFARFKALTFDCYGTLIDWETGILSTLKTWRHSHGLIIDDARILEEFGKSESRIERDNPSLPYTDILRHVHHALARNLGLPEDMDEAAYFAGSVGDWPPFPDTIDALRDLQKRFKLVIVSNTDHSSFARTRKRLGIEFDAVVIAEEVGAYKPDHRMFARAFAVLAELGIDRSQILHVAQSLYHDHVPAKELGLSTVWIDRYRGLRSSGAAVLPSGEVHPDYTVTTLRELADLVSGSKV